MTERPVVIAGNWKMYKTIEEAQVFIEKLKPAVAKADCGVYLAVPFTAIKPAADKAAGTNIVVGAQNMNDAREGAFTGEIAGIMLVEAGAKFVILGHSERRRIFGETNELINKKIKRAIKEGLQPLVCIGETAKERDAGHAEQKLEEQITQTFAEISPEDMQKCLLAYEPVWAIGTGKASTPENAQQMHTLCRELIGRLWNEEIAAKIGILYGGSVTPRNAPEFIEQPDIDGVLVGGASLTPETFSEIVNYQTIKKVKEVT